MKMKNKFVLWLCNLAFLSFSVNAFNTPDSINIVLKNAKHETYAQLYNQLADYYYSISLDSCILYAKKAQLSASENSNKKQMGIAMVTLAKVHNKLGGYEDAYQNLSDAIICFSAINDNKEIINALNYTGIVSNSQSDYKRALEFYYKALKLAEDSKDKEGITKVLNNIGIVYENLNEPISAIEYYQKSLQINAEIGYEKGIASSLNNIGSVYFGIGDYLKALEIFQKSLTIKQKINDKKGISATLNNIGNCYYSIPQYDMAIEYFNKSIEIEKEISNDLGVANSLENIGNVYSDMKNYSKALEYYSKSLEIALKIDASQQVLNCYKNLSETYSFIGDYKNAYLMHLQYSKVHKQIFNDENFQKINELETKYQTRQRELEYQQMVEVSRRRQQIIIAGSVVTGLIIFSFYYLYRIKNKANKKLKEQNEHINKQKTELEFQKNCVTQQCDMISQQNQSIMDSITYARFIQTAILPPPYYTDQFFAENFILYRPRDVVSGDFYWMLKHENSFIIAAADCTGHGVPGGFLSMMGIAFLNEIVGSQILELKASQILNVLREKVINALHQTGKQGVSQDGMDIALCIINLDTLQMQFAGAYNSLYLVRYSRQFPLEHVDISDNQKIKVSANDEKAYLLEIKADKMPISYSVRPKLTFTNHIIQLYKSDVIYLFTDGYSDQFGGNFDKKLKPYKFRNVLVEIFDKSMSEQKKILEDSLDNWKNGTAQIDDILVVGLRI